jgi:hypothetical protein
MSVLKSTLIGLVTAAIAHAAVQPSRPAIENQVPANTSGVAFVNFERAFALHGDILKKSTWYKNALPYITAGLPDPATDLRQAGMTIQLENLNKPSWGFVSQGTIDVARLATFAAGQHLVITPSIYQGIKLMTTIFRRQSCQLAFVDPTTAFLTVDRDGAHWETPAIVATLRSQAPSYGSATGTILPDDYLAYASLKLTKELQENIAHVAFPVVRNIEQATLQAMAVDAAHDVNVTIVARCDTPAAVAELQQLVTNYLPSLTGPQGIFNTLDMFPHDGILAIKATMTKAQLERLLTR